MTKAKVLMTRIVPEQAMEKVRGQCDLAVWEEDCAVPQDWLVKNIGDAQGLFCLLTDKVDEDILLAATKLQVVSTMAVGYDNIDVSACTKRGIPIGNTPGALTETTADFTFTLMMAAARRIVEGVDYVREGRWQTWGPTLLLGQDVYEATLGIIGFGRIGKAVARRASGFNMRVLACGSEDGKDPPPADSTEVEWVGKDKLLEEADFISLHVPLTHQTTHLIGRRELQLMKKTAVLVNTSRGPVIDHKALYEALKNGEIAAAALDVTDPEPISIDDPLLTLPNCLIVPHVASGTVATRTKIAIMAADNLLAGIRGDRLPFCVNPDVYPV